MHLIIPNNSVCSPMLDNLFQQQHSRLLFSAQLCYSRHHTVIAVVVVFVAVVVLMHISFFLYQGYEFDKYNK